jgi:hypothetical protein
MSGGSLECPPEQFAGGFIAMWPKDVGRHRLNDRRAAAIVNTLRLLSDLLGEIYPPLTKLR